MALTRAKYYDRGQAETKCLWPRSRLWFHGYGRGWGQNFGL